MLLRLKAQRYNSDDLYLDNQWPLVCFSKVLKRGLDMLSFASTRQKSNGAVKRGKRLSLICSDYLAEVSIERKNPKMASCDIIGLLSAINLVLEASAIDGSKCKYYKTERSAWAVKLVLRIVLCQWRKNNVGHTLKEDHPMRHSLRLRLLQDVSDARLIDLGEGLKYQDLRVGGGAPLQKGYLTVLHYKYELRFITSLADIF